MSYYEDMFLKQKKLFDKGITKKINIRISALLALKKAILKNEKEVLKALYMDLGKSKFESYSCEIGIVIKEINFVLKNIKNWTKSKPVKTPFYLQPSVSQKLFSPYGVVLIIGAFNYPFQLTMLPLVGALAAGNCVTIKPSEIAENVSAVIKKILYDSGIPFSYVSVFEGDKEINKQLLNLDYNYIFFTGSKDIGKLVLQKASEKLIPVTLELGGKSPVIVEETANIKIAAKKIVWGKFLNSGQTCVAPDYILVDKKIKDRLICEMICIIKDFYGEDSLVSKDYSRIINQKHFLRLKDILYNENKNIIFGGKSIENNLYIEPTILNCNFNSYVMKDEIFGPILPVIGVDNMKQAVKYIQRHDRPLALYVFTKNKKFVDKVINYLDFGGGCINDVVMHIVNYNLPFGGIGASGMGSYHGYNSFVTFSHVKGITKKTTAFELPLLYPPYNTIGYYIIKKIFNL